jgi:hypothetical protein
MPNDSEKLELVMKVESVTDVYEAQCLVAPHIHGEDPQKHASNFNADYLPPKYSGNKAKNLIGKTIKIVTTITILD